MKSFNSTLGLSDSMHRHGLLWLCLALAGVVFSLPTAASVPCDICPQRFQVCNDAAVGEWDQCTWNAEQFLRSNCYPPDAPADQYCLETVAEMMEQCDFDYEIERSNCDFDEAICLMDCVECADEEDEHGGA